MTSLLADAHVEFIHHPDDERELPNPQITHGQITPDQIDQIKPELLFLACWIEPTGDAWSKLNYVIDAYLTVIRSRGWQLVDTASDLNKPGLKVILHLEDAAAVTSQAQLDQIFAKGIRSVGLTHNAANQYAGGALTDLGLSDAGRDLIKQIATRGGLLDWAHLSRRALFDVAQAFPQLPPFISHAGIKAAHDTPRNLDDETLRLVHDRGGWIGLGLARSFLSAESATLDDYARQVAHATNICGPDHVGVGSDLGGIISGLPAGISSWLDIGQLAGSLCDPRQAGQNLVDWLPGYYSALERL